MWGSTTSLMPHTPIAPNKAFKGKSAAGLYGDWVQEVDWSLGGVMAALERNGLADNTLLVFTSDNGSPARDGTNMGGPAGSVKRFGHHPSGPWRGMKADIWEGGHRVPFIARWPGRVDAGTTSEEQIVLTDLMRTVAQIVGHELPEDSAEDSYDLGPALFGGVRTEPIRDHMIHHSHNGVFAIRVGDMKLILGKGSGGFTAFTPAEDAPPGQLYDLAADPGEANNLWREKPEVVAQLTELLRKHRTATRTHPFGKGTEKTGRAMDGSSRMETQPPKRIRPSSVAGEAPGRRGPEPSASRARELEWPSAPSSDHPDRTCC